MATELTPGAQAKADFETALSLAMRAARRAGLTPAYLAGRLVAAYDDRYERPDDHA